MSVQKDERKSYMKYVLLMAAVAAASVLANAHNASRANKYVQRAVLNGKPLSSFFFPAKEVLKGGTLELWMGSEPNKQWGCGR